MASFPYIWDFAIGDGLTLRILLAAGKAFGRYAWELSLTGKALVDRSLLIMKLMRTLVFQGFC